MQRVPVHRQDLMLPGLMLPGQRDEVAADAAAQVGQHPGRREPGLAVPGHDLGRGLFQAGPGKEHVHGPAELRPGREPQLVLGQGRGHQPGRVRLTQPGAQGQRGARGDGLVAQRGQELGAGAGQQRVEIPEPAVLGRGRRAGVRRAGHGARLSGPGAARG